MKKLFTASMVLAFASMQVNSLSADVEYTQWEADSIAALIHDARSKQQNILLVVTQPDWCPPCIAMENAIINNPEELEFSALAKDWVNLEILGYDQAGAEFLQSQGIRFHGTPTTMLLDPARIMNPLKAKQAKLRKGALTLGDLKVVHSLAGFPDDFTAQFKRAANGYDLLADAQKAMREEQSIESYETLATAYIDQGDVKQANRVFKSLFFRTDLTTDKRKELEWKQIADVTQRVAKDHALTLSQIEGFVAKHPSFLEEKNTYQDFAYKKAWSLVAVGQIEEAKDLMHKAYVVSDESGQQDVGDIRTYLYFAFRNPNVELVKDAYALNLLALKKFPESEGALQASRGRLLRRMNKLAEAKAAFERAIELLPEESDARETYVGQLEFVKAQMAAENTQAVKS